MHSCHLSKSVHYFMARIIIGLPVFNKQRGTYSYYVRKTNLSFCVRFVFYSLEISYL